jgi:hypothetical protein
MNSRLTPLSCEAKTLGDWSLGSAPSEALIQFTREGLNCTSDLTKLSEVFARRQTLRLRALLHADLIRVVIDQINRGKWIPRDHDTIGREVVLDSVGALSTLLFISNAPAFLHAIEQVTGCGPITMFDGRVYRIVPGTDHYDTWHDDVGDNRLIGMSINLGREPYSGGVFQLREKGGPILQELPNVIQGDAILFRISPNLKHRVTPVEGRIPKTAFAGWFRSGTRELFRRDSVC